MSLDELIEELGLKSTHWCGAEIPTDWEAIVVPLIRMLSVYPLTIHQVKEKFGGLRVYFGWENDADAEIKEHVRLLVELAELQCHAAYRLREKE